ncbi:MAG: ElyC/SanA/YdcF family protein [bacterium]
MAFVPGLPILAAAWLTGTTRRHRFASAEDAPEREVAIVPGCPPHPDGLPTPMLEDRLACALELYRLGKVDRILASGDDRADRSGEATCMERWLVERGVPADRLLVDGAAFRTRDTMIHAAERLGIRSAVVCTQAFHLSRSVFVARELGIDAVGVRADRRRYRNPYFTIARELAAQTLAFVEAYLGPHRAVKGKSRPAVGLHARRAVRLPRS